MPSSSEKPRPRYDPPGREQLNMWMGEAEFAFLRRKAKLEARSVTDVVREIIRAAMERERETLR